jgi:hypothetical protein
MDRYIGTLIGVINPNTLSVYIPLGFGIYIDKVISLEGVSPDGKISDTKYWFDTHGDDIVLFITDEDASNVVVGTTKSNVPTLNEYLRKVSK